MIGKERTSELMDEFESDLDMSEFIRDEVLMDEQNIEDLIEAFDPNTGEDDAKAALFRVISREMEEVEEYIAIVGTEPQVHLTSASMEEIKQAIQRARECTPGLKNAPAWIGTREMVHPGEGYENEEYTHYQHRPNGKWQKIEDRGMNYRLRD